MSIFLGAVKTKEKEEKYYVVKFSHKRRDDAECEYVFGVKSEKEAIKVAFEQHRKIYPRIAIEFLSVWDSVSKIEKYNDGSKRYQKYPC
jgi:hypothetical protein